VKAILLIAMVICTSELEAQFDRVKGFRLYGRDASQLPIASLEGDRFTVEFDIFEDEPPDLYLQFVHCDKNWSPTSSLFVNDPIKRRTRFPLPFRVASDGVKYYRYQYRFVVPSDPLFPTFIHSGNYVVELRDGKNDDLLAREKVFVIERKLRPAMRISNRSLPSTINPYNEALQVEVRVQIPEIDSLTREPYIPYNLRTVVLVRNKEIERAWRIDVDDQNPETYVEGFSLRHPTFVISDVPVGTEYRQMDLRNVTEYPEGSVLRPRLGADVSRFQQRPRGDADGGATYRQNDRYSDYVAYQFELLWDSPPGTIVHVVGDFNGWHPDERSRMVQEGGRFLWKTWLRRGIYDYQYLVRNGDWITLEGNDWRSVSNFTAFVYYRDPRYGGFDRILGVARGRNRGELQ